MTARARGAGRQARNADFANWDYQAMDLGQCVKTEIK